MDPSLAARSLDISSRRRLASASARLLLARGGGRAEQRLISRASHLFVAFNLIRWLARAARSFMAELHSRMR